MKPTKFKIIINDKANEFEEEVNEALSNGYTFLGDTRIENGVFIQPMVVVEMITPVQMPVKKVEEK